MKLINLSLREFALPVPRTGSLETDSGYGRSAAQGREIHLRVQKKRAKADSSYRSEITISGVFQRKGFSFRIEGRMDGVYIQPKPRIEEIKTSFSLRHLHRRLLEDPLGHPYCLQLLTYGYLYRLQHNVTPSLSFHLVSSRNGESVDLELPFDPVTYERWLQQRLDELVRETREAEKEAARRVKLSAAFVFPFATPRSGQTDLMRTVEQGMAEQRPMLLQAPTGLGKTMGVLYPVLREALGRGQKVIYVTPKNSQHSVAEDAVHRLREQGAKLRSLTITAKGRICFQNEPICTPEYCEYARDYYTKLHQHGIESILARKRRLKRRFFREIGERYRVCPFELQFACVDRADLVICDYNYVFAPRSARESLTGITAGQSGKPNLVIDEAHNLPNRAMEHYSPSLSSLVLEKMKEDIPRLVPGFRQEAEELVDGCIRVIASCRPGRDRPATRIQPPVRAFQEQDLRVRGVLVRYLESNVEIERQDPILRLGYYWATFTEMLEYAGADRPEFFTTFQPDSSRGMVKITCCDAGSMLRETYTGFNHVVAFSATLKPFGYYAGLSGFDAERVLTAEFDTPFPRERRKILLIPQVSTSYQRRENNYGKIAEAVERIVSLRRGNYLVFLPSFDFLERIVSRFRIPHGFELLRQERQTAPGMVASILDRLRSSDHPTIVFAVQGGSFSEGLDYAGDMVIGAFIVGPPLPNYDPEREEMKKYYQSRYGDGFAYAYVIPAMAKAVQAAGRVIRSESDRGIIVLMDSRFREPRYSSAMPSDWFSSSVTELISGSILKEIGDFWSSCDRADSFLLDKSAIIPLPT